MVTRASFMRMNIAAFGAMAFFGQANAADLYRSGGLKDTPYDAAETWTGFYTGVNGGYAWRSNNDQFSYPAGSFYDIPYPAYGGIGADGGFWGGQIGYNWQSAFSWTPIVLGIEADIQGAGIEGKGVDLSGEAFKTNLDWFGTVRGRIGYAADRTFVYFTGGFAFGGLRQAAEDSGYPAYYKSDSTVTGYVLGGGVEYKFNPSWSVKAEYQYLNFGKNDPAATSGGVPLTASADGFKVGDDTFHTVRVGLNYHIHQDYVPLK